MMMRALRIECMVYIRIDDGSLELISNLFGPFTKDRFTDSFNLKVEKLYSNCHSVTTLVIKRKILNCC